MKEKDQSGQLIDHSKNIDPKYRTPGKLHSEKPLTNDQLLTENQYEATQQSMTVQKPGAGFGFSFVSVSPTKKQLVDSFQLKHIKVIQQAEAKNWRGLEILFTQKPGIPNIQTNKKYADMVNYFKLEDERFKFFMDQMNKYRDQENEAQAVEGTSGQGGAGIVNNTAKLANAGKEIASQGSRVNINSEFINFKQLKDLSLLNRDGISVLCYSKPAYVDQQSAHELNFKMVKADAKLVKAIFESNGFVHTEGHDWNVLWSSQSFKPHIYDNLNEYQKVNHFPMSSELTRKDRLCANIVKMQEKFGKEAFNIIPDTYILPDEFADFYSHFHNLRSKEQNNMWIIKPQNSSQGKGIYIIDDISEVPIDENCIISRYVANPFLINGLKFDMRIYVCITSMDPWRIYMYNEGLVRFACELYDLQMGKGAKYSHLTNYSINKKNEKYVGNANADIDDTGHKWSLAGLTKHLEHIGVDMNLLWSRIYDVVIKSIMCIDGPVQAQLKKQNIRNNCFELLGYDILIDSDLKPWLMEVNLSPSLATDTPLDLKIKSSLFLDTINLISLKKVDRRRDNLNHLKNRVKNIMRAKSYQQRQNYPGSAAPSKHVAFGGAEERQRRIPLQGAGTNVGRELEEMVESRGRNVVDRISQLNSKLRDITRDFLVENQRRGNYIRIYPSKTCAVYDQYLMNTKPLNRLLYRCVFTDEIVPFPPGYPASQNQLHSSKQSKKQQLHNNLAAANDSSSAVLGSDLTPSTGKIHTESGQAGAFPIPLDRRSSGQKSLFTSSTNTGNAESKGSSTMVNAIIRKRQESATQRQKQANQAPSTANASQQGTQQSTPQGASQIMQPAQRENGGQGGGREKLLITGDDVLIEYVHRLMLAVQSIKEAMLKPAWKNQIEKFIKHYVWHSSDVRRAANNKLWQRLESRLIEMKERRKRLLQSIYFRQRNMNHSNLPNVDNGNNSQTGDYSTDFQREYEQKEAQKNVIIQGFSAQQLEDMLRTSTRNVAYEVISCLIDQSGRGVLTEIIKLLTTGRSNNIFEDNGSSILDNLQRNYTNAHGKHRNIVRKFPKGSSIGRGQPNRSSGTVIDDDEDELTESYQRVEQQQHQSSFTGGSNLNTRTPYKKNSSLSNTSLATPVQVGSALLKSAPGVNPANVNNSAGNINDVRIKIRKNSIEPQQAIKASHKPMFVKPKNAGAQTNHGTTIVKHENVIFEEPSQEEFGRSSIANLDSNGAPSLQLHQSKNDVSPDKQSIDAQARTLATQHHSSILVAGGNGNESNQNFTPSNSNRFAQSRGLPGGFLDQIEQMSTKQQPNNGEVMSNSAYSYGEPRSASIAPSSQEGFTIVGDSSQQNNTTATEHGPESGLDSAGRFTGARLTGPDIEANANFVKLDQHVSSSVKYQHSIISSGGSNGLRENRLLRSRGGQIKLPEGANGEKQEYNHQMDSRQTQNTFQETASDRGNETTSGVDQANSQGHAKQPAERQDLKVRAPFQSDNSHSQQQQIATGKSMNPMSKGRGAQHGHSGKRASPQKQFKGTKDGSVGAVIMSANEITLNRPLANKNETTADSEPGSSVVTKRPRRTAQGGGKATAQ